MKSEPPHTPTTTERIFARAYDDCVLDKDRGRGHRILVDGYWVTAVHVEDVREEFMKHIVTGEGKEMSRAAKRTEWGRALKNKHLFKLYRREERNGVEWIWSVKQEELNVLLCKN